MFETLTSSDIVLILVGITIFLSFHLFSQAITLVVDLAQDLLEQYRTERNRL